MDAPHFTMRTPQGCCAHACWAIYRSARGREGSSNGGECALAFWLPGATDPGQWRGWKQAATAAGVSENVGRPSLCVRLFVLVFTGYFFRTKRQETETHAPAQACAFVWFALKAFIGLHVPSVSMHKNPGLQIFWGFIVLQPLYLLRSDLPRTFRFASISFSEFLTEQSLAVRS